MSRENDQDMVERIEWFSPVHYEVLKFFEDHDILISPRDLSKNINYGRGYVGDALRELKGAGLVDQDGQVYHLTEQGRKFLEGEVDAELIEDRDPTDD